MSPVRLRIAADGKVQGLWTDAVDWPVVDRLTLRQASHIEFYEQAQKWLVPAAKPRKALRICGRDSPADRPGRSCTGPPRVPQLWRGRRISLRRAKQVGKARQRYGSLAADHPDRYADRRTVIWLVRRRCLPLLPTGR
jgi:hypothetical protein